MAYILIVIIGIGLEWLTQGYIPTAFFVAVTLTALLAAYLIGLGLKRDAQQREDRDE